MKKIWMTGLLCLFGVVSLMAKPQSIMGSEQYRTQQAYPVAPFTTLSINGQTEVEFVQAPQETYTVSFAGPYNLAELIEIKSQDGVLHIYYKKPIVVLGDQRLRVQVAAPDLTRIEIKESGELHIHQPLMTQSLEIEAAGKAEIEIDELQAQTVQADLRGDGEVEILKLMCQILQVKAADTASFDAQGADCDTVHIWASNRAEVAVTGLNGQNVTAENWHSSEIELKGRVSTASLTARGRSEIDAEGLQAENADVLAERAAHIGVRVSGTLNAQTQGRGVVEYRGWPQQINRTGKGTVKQDK